MLDIFCLNYNGANQHDPFLEAVSSFVESANLSFVRMCLKKLGTLRKDKEETARKKLRAWINACSIERPLITKSLPRLKLIADERLGDFVTVRGTKVDDYCKDLVMKLMEAEESACDESRIDHELMVKMLSNSFMKSLKKGNKEGMSNYTLAGQRAEKQILCEFYKLHTSNMSKVKRDNHALYNDW